MILAHNSRLHLIAEGTLRQQELQTTCHSASTVKGRQGMDADTLVLSSPLYCQHLHSSGALHTLSELGLSTPINRYSRHPPQTCLCANFIYATPALRLSLVVLDCVKMTVKTNHCEYHRFHLIGSNQVDLFILTSLNLITKPFYGIAGHLPTLPLWHSLHQPAPGSFFSTPTSAIQGGTTTDSPSHLPELCFHLQLPLWRNDKD